MNTLIVGGTFNDQGGRKSGYISKFSQEYSKYCSITLFNGGNFEDLNIFLNNDPNIFNVGDFVRDDFGNGQIGQIVMCPNPDMYLVKTEPEIMTVKFDTKEVAVKTFAIGALVKQINTYDAILWFADVPNDKEKLVQNIKKQFPKTILATSKRNLDGKYKPQDLIARALKNKSNITLEFVSADEGFGVSIHDPLGNCFLYKETDIAKVAQETFKQMTRLSAYTRIGSISVGTNLDIPEEETFFDIIKKYAETFHALIHADTTRFLGNASFRCERGFPSFKKNNLIYVSQRNIDKRFIGKEGFVPVENREDCVEYYGNNKPSVDTPIQVKLYNYYKNVSYMLHSHVYVKDAKTTEFPVPCGAIEEFDEIIKLYPDKNTTNVAINLIGHGSLILASSTDFIENINYISRPCPEYIKNDK